MITALEIRISIVLKLYFSNSTILSCFFFSSFIIDLYFLIPATISQSFITIAEFTIPTGTESNEANAEIETQPVNF